jgi:hypothetical protein
MMMVTVVMAYFALFDTAFALGAGGLHRNSTPDVDLDPTWPKRRAASRWLSPAAWRACRSRA